MTWTRRVFVKEALAGWLALVIGPVAYGALRWRLSGDLSQPRELSIGTADLFKPGTSKQVFFGNEKVIVVRSAGGTFMAASAVCTHQGCSIRYEAKSGVEELACNCHESRFELDGQLISGPAVIPLRRFQISVRSGELILAPGSDEDGSG
jgi:Rieske Fe-S protein